MKQPNAYKTFDQTTKQTMGLKTPLCIQSHIHKIKNMHHTYSLEYNAEVLKKVEILVALFLSINLSP